MPVVMNKRTRNDKQDLSFALNHFDKFSSDDQILKCNVGNLDVIERADELFELANSKIHIFPYKNIEPCWFRLYTDTSIVRAVQLSVADGCENDGRQHGWIDEAVKMLDMALIMAGGLGRKEVIDSLMEYMKELAAQQSPKRIRADIENNSAVCSVETTDVLPSERYSIPKITHSVDCLKAPSLSSFETRMQLRQPMVLEGVLETWKAMKEWNSRAYWLSKTLGGRRLVPVEVGRSYVDEGWSQKIMTFGDFLENHIVHSTEQSNATAEKGYLAQHDLFHQILDLEEDFLTPDYCYMDAPLPETGTPVALRNAELNHASHLLVSTQSTNLETDETEVQKNIWFGPAWTISPLHHDPYHNILCQVVGTKYIRLYSPHVSDKLIPRPVDEPALHQTDSHSGSQATIDMSNTSSIDFAAIELSPAEDWDEIYPGFSEIPYLECILEAGQALYIPIGWWHYVRSCSVGISVSFWWN